EAALILDRIFYIAERPRPDVGISKQKIEKIREIAPQLKKIKDFQNILKDYKKNKIEADNFLDVMVNRLEINETQASRIINEIFPEFRDLQPVPTSRTLRSHTTALWFPVLGALQGKRPLPIQLFHVGLKFRREQKLDASHLYASNTLSLVICNDEMTLEDGMAIAKEICIKIGFADAKFEIKKTTGKYYAPGMEFEIFIKHGDDDNWLEIGDGGFYSPISCAKFGIRYPVFNIGFGVERITMIKTGVKDIRELAYPYFYKAVEYSDEEMAGMIEIRRRPKSKEGIEIAKEIVKVALDKGDEKSPCKFKVGTFNIDGVKLEIIIWEHEAGVKLIGGASFNEIVVKNGEIFCFDSRKQSPPALATTTGIRFIEAIANDFAWNAERFTRTGEKEMIKQYKMVKKASDINVQIDQSVVRYLTSKQKRIKINGPVFVNLKAIKI
ncbi:MAG: tRNA ligase subunit PheS family protein, partial [Promethearchaeota archaeon]